MIRFRKFDVITSLLMSTILSHIEETKHIDLRFGFRNLVEGERMICSNTTLVDYIRSDFSLTNDILYLIPLTVNMGSPPLVLLTAEAALIQAIPLAGFLNISPTEGRFGTTCC
jgi:hypothetical protein